MDDNNLNNTSSSNNSQFPSQPVHDGVMGIDDSSSSIKSPISQDTPNPDGNLVVDHADENQDNDLLTIREKALDDLSPIVKNLEQTPEEKFHTTMMMIQASDNQSLIPEAYEAAKKIENEKERAQALLDVVNEINYFTHGKDK